MPRYCWGQQQVPRLIIDESSDSYRIAVEDTIRTIPKSKVWGCTDWPFEIGDRVRMLCGYYWTPGTVAGPLRVRLDRGQTVPVWNSDTVRAINESITKEIGVIETEPESLIAPILPRTAKKSSKSKSKAVEAQKNCDFCTSLATLLCDGRLDRRTCDRFICSNCAKQVGNFFACSRSHPSNSFVDTVDWCPDCMARHQLREQSKINAEVKSSSLLTDIDESKQHQSDIKVPSGGAETIDTPLQTASIDEASRKRPTLYFDIPEGTKQSVCKGCAAKIYWVLTQNGKRMPVDPDGQAHWGTCPKSKDFGKNKTKPLEAVPMPDLDGAEEEEIEVAKAAGSFEALSPGERVRIVYAGAPLEHLTGLLGTVDGPETFGLIPVHVDGHGSKVLRREQLDLVGDPDDRPSDRDPGDRDPGEVIQPGGKVTLTRRWPGKSAELRPLVPI